MSMHGHHASAVRIIAVSAIGGGVIMLLVVGYLLWGTSAYTAHSQRELHRERAGGRHFQRADSRQHHRTEHPRPVNGQALATVRIPAFGSGYRYVIIEGTSPADLRKGPGHYAGSALPGQLGNFVVSGHNATHMAPFSRIDELSPGRPDPHSHAPTRLHLPCYRSSRGAADQPGCYRTGTGSPGCHAAYRPDHADDLLSQVFQFSSSDRLGEAHVIAVTRYQPADLNRVQLPLFTHGRESAAPAG